MARGRQPRSRTRRRRKSRPKRQGVFFAFPSRPESVGESINLALAHLKADPQIKETGLRFHPWPDMSVSGRRLLDEITTQIDRSTVVACDVTYPNANVAFELGYAVGQFKRVWLSLDPSIANAPRDFNRSYLGLLGLGYSSYENHRELAESLLADAPWNSSHEVLLGDTYRERRPHSEDATLLYVMPPISTDAVIAVQEEISESIFRRNPILDDPREFANPTLEWYADKVCDADGVLVHLLSDDHRDTTAHNTRASWVAGLAYGMNRPLLMLAHAQFVCPTDYQTLLHVHDTAEQASLLFRSWHQPFDIRPRRPRRPALSSPRVPQPLQLRDLSLGEPVAENEVTRLDEYFVETSAFFEARSADVSIFVGRRGTGKTASFVALADDLRRDRRNHVCTVKPVGYEVDGLIHLLSERWKAAERGFLVESLWKFLIYSELAKSLIESIEARPIHGQTTEEEQALVDYVTQQSDVLLSPFSQRLNRAVGQLRGAGGLSDIEDQRARISENLHIEHLGRLRRLLGSALHSRHRVAILVDNLDHQWQAGSNTQALSTLLLGLLRATQEIVGDFQRNLERRRRVNVAMTIFIRSDIFSQLEPLATEQDKWPVRRMTWNDPDLLIRVIEERLSHAGQSTLDAKEIWELAFPAAITDMPPKRFSIENTLPRPRDVVFLAKEAVAVGVNRKHEAVTEDDMLLARKRYSNYVFGSILAEDDPQRLMMESILYEFAGSEREVSKADVLSRVRQAGVPEPDNESYVHLLCDVNFFGIRTASGYTFSEHENERSVLLRLAEKLAIENEWGDVWFKTHPAFYDVLQIE